MQDNNVVFFVALAKIVTPVGAPAGAGAACAALHFTVLFTRKFSRCGKADDIYRPVVLSALV
jgi:hypothetical protein